MERLIFEKQLEFLPSSQISHSRLGLGFEKLDRAVFDPNKAYDKVARTGVKMIRIQSGWARTETVPGVYDFRWLDEIVDNLLARGLEPWLDLCYGNALYTPLAKPVFGAVGCPPIMSEEEMQAWLRYVDATVRHFTGRITLYEIWNEPNNNFSWRHEEGDYSVNKKDLVRNAREYGIFASRTAQAIKTADPKARVAGGSIARPGNLQYSNDILATGLYKYIDALTFHIYSSFDGDRQQTIEGLRNLVDLYDPSITLIQGEAGAQSRSDGNGAMKGFAWTREKQLKYLLRTLICDLWCGVEFTSYFSTLDMIEALRGRLADKASYLDYGYFGVLSAEFDENGISTGEYSEKPSYYALSTLATLMRGDCRRLDIPWAREYLPSLRVNGTDCGDNTLKVYGFRLQDGSTALCYWNCVNLLTSTYEGTLSMCVYGQKNDRIRIMDLATGKIYKMPDSMVQDLGNGGVSLRNIPLTDTPLALLFG